MKTARPRSKIPINITMKTVTASENSTSACPRRARADRKGSHGAHGLVVTLTYVVVVTLGTPGTVTVRATTNVSPRCCAP